MRIIFMTKLAAAPIHTERVSRPSRLVVTRYCIPITLLKPIIGNSVAIIMMRYGTFSYPGPKNHGEKLRAMPIRPKHRARPINQTN